MDEQTGLSKAKEDSPVPIVAFLGPISSYTHQVLRSFGPLGHFWRLSWSLGLTDFDIAQAALSSFEADRYKYEPADTITGTSIESAKW